MKRQSYIWAMLAVVLFPVVVTGCYAHRDIVETDTFIPVQVQETPPPPVGSIWPGENAKNALFADNKARYVNDIVTIVISESASGTNSANTTTSRETETLAGISALLGMDRKIARQNKDLTNGDDVYTAGLLPSIQAGGSSTNKLTGKGSTARSNTLEATITARVIDVLPNGNLKIEGRRRLAVNAEDQYIVISGTVRPEDVTSDNVVYSEFIADAKIVYSGKGVVDDKMRPGWLARIVDWVWPF